jgi:branched-subunit amino acid ABC-type transport system permease component
LGVAAFLAVVLWVLLHRTRLGLQMRAATDRPELAQLMGVNRSLATGSAWITGTTLACIAGIVGAPIINSLDPVSYITVVFVATAAAAIGGFRSIPLAFAAGLALGVAQNLVAGYATFALRRAPGGRADLRAQPGPTGRIDRRGHRSGHCHG